MGKPAAFVLYALVLVMSVCVRALRINGLDCISHCNRGMRGIHKLHMSTSVAVLPSVFQENKESFLTTDNVKMQILQLGATLDRGQVYNPTSGEQYKQNMDIARKKIELLISKRRPNSLRFRAMEGEWELVLSTVPHGIVSSSLLQYSSYSSISIDLPYILLVSIFTIFLSNSTSICGCRTGG